MTINICIADDHQLFSKSLGMLINSFSGFRTIMDASNGDELIRRLAVAKQLPDICLVDVNMPVMDGPDAVTKITADYPMIRTVALSMKDNDITIISMLKAGCCAYLLKDIHPDELEKALREVYDKGFYNADMLNLNFRRLLKSQQETPIQFNEKEKRFLQLACSDLTYKQIAAEMHLAERTIDGYREAMFGKLNVQSRVGMALEAIRRKLVEV